MFFNQRMARLARLSPIFTFGMGQGATGSESSAPPPFVPTSIAGLQLWLKADAGTFQNSALTTPATADGDPIGGWADQSGSSHNITQGTSSKKPTLKLAIQNGLPVIRTDGIDDFLNGVDLSALTAATVFVVLYGGRVAGAANAHWHFGACESTSGAASYFSFADENIYEGFGSAARHSSGTPVTNIRQVWVLYEITDAASAFTSYLNGSQQFTTATNTVGFPSSCAIGGSDDQGSGVPTVFWLGDYAEMLIYDSVLTGANRTLVRNYLNGRWAVY